MYLLPDQTPAQESQDGPEGGQDGTWRAPRIGQRRSAVARSQLRSYVNSNNYIHTSIDEHIHAYLVHKYPT